MKTIVSMVAAALITMLATNEVLANEADSVKVENKVTKTIRIEKDGKTIVDTTFVGHGNGFRPFMDENFRGNRMGMRNRGGFGRGEGKGRNMPQFGGMRHMMPELGEGDSAKEMGFRGPRMGFGAFDMPRRGGDNFMPHRQGSRQFAQMGPKMKGKNGIDLNDPRIVSLERTTTKDGDEKIVIIRKKKD